MSSVNNGDMSNQLKIYTGGDVSKIGVKKIFDDSIRQFETQLNTPVPKNADINPDAYNFQHPVRGFGIVISIENFTKLRRRSYAKKELQSMYEMLTKLEFQVMLFTDLEVQQIKDVLTEAASRKEVHEKADTFACIIGSHGRESNDDVINVKDKKEEKKRIDNYHHAIWGTDRRVLTKELISLFEDGSCPGLIGKPRMFFLETCRKRKGNISNRYDEGVDVLVSDNGEGDDVPENDNDEVADVPKNDNGEKVDVPKNDNDEVADVPKNDNGEKVDVPENDNDEVADVPKNDNGEKVDVPENDNDEVADVPKNDNGEKVDVPKNDNGEGADVPKNDNGEKVDVPKNDNGEGVDVPKNDNGEGVDVPKNDNGERVDVPKNDNGEGADVPKNDNGEKVNVPENDKCEGVDVPENDNVGDIYSTDSDSGQDIEENDKCEGVDVPENDNVGDIYSTDSDSGQDIEETGSPIRENMFGDRKEKRKKIKVYLPFCPNHFYLIYSTSEGKVAFGNKDKGGWMLQAFSTVIKENRDHEADLLTLSTEACYFGAIHLEALDKKSERVLKAAITIEHRLTKDIYFRKKKQTSI